MHLGLIGAGNISATHLRAARTVPGVVVSAVYSPTFEKARQLAEMAGAVPYRTLEEFLSHKPLDFVAIGTASGVHAEQATAAVRQGLHVLVEKPLDISTVRIDSLIEAADRAGVRVGVFFQDRCKPDLLSVKRMVDAGALGRPVMAAGRVKWHRPAEYYGASRWRGTLALDGGGALMNQGIHTVDTIQWLFGPVASVSAAIATRVHAIEAEDTAAAVLTFASGAIGVVEAATSVFPGYSRRIELTGSEGTVIVEQDTLAAVHLRNQSDSDQAGAQTARSNHGSSAAVSAAVDDATPHARILQDFVEAIRTGRSPACDAREGRRSVEIVEAIYRSARSGRTISLGVRS